MYRIFVLLCLTGFLSRPATADIIYAFDQSNYEVAPNGTVDVSVFLRQIAPSAGDPVDLGGDGIVSGGVRVFFNDTPPSDRAEVLALTDISPNPLFDEAFLGADFDLDPGVSAGFVDSVDDVFSPLTGSSILLGTFRFTAGSIAGEVTNLLATDFSGFDETVGGDLAFTSLDNFIGQGTATITVAAAVPEPSTFLMLAGIFVIGLGYRRRSAKIVARDS